METLYWHDYETFGSNPQIDRATQFAGVRTDLDLNIIDEPLIIYNWPALDVLPHPQACLITGITPQQAFAEGMPEVDFINAINDQLSVAETCTCGYNSIRFDDEVTRHTLYRNLLDPYAREWMNGNSRWDLIDVVRLTQALRPEGINWPQREDQSPSFRLEELTKANGLQHEAAHDALSDVHATIAIAKLIRERQPKLYDFAFQNRRKKAVTEILKPGTLQPFVHVSGRYAATRNCIAVVVVLCVHPTNPNGYIVYDLGEDPKALIECDLEELKQRLFTSQAELPESLTRIPLKTIHINRAPVVAPVSVLRAQDAERLNIDRKRCEHHLNVLQRADNKALAEKIQAAFQLEETNHESLDPELMLYRGAFFSAEDKKTMQRIHQTLPEDLADLSINFDDERLTTLYLRFRARNYPETLTGEEREEWYQHCREIRQNRQPFLSFEEFWEQMELLRSDSAKSQAQLTILETVSEYAEELERELGFET